MCVCLCVCKKQEKHGFWERLLGQRVKMTWAKTRKEQMSEHNVVIVNIPSLIHLINALLSPSSAQNFP